MKKLNPNIHALINLLADGNFHSGDELGQALDMSRAGVWKLIKQVQALGPDIEVVKGKGYRLLKALVLLDETRLGTAMARYFPGGVLHVYPLVDSTNTRLAATPCGRSRQTQVCLAEKQELGRGRFERTWYSPFAENIYFSIKYCFMMDVSALSGLSIVVGVALVRLFERLGVPEPAQIKWPNDILCRGQKLAGTLIEITAESHAPACAIIGVGMNINMTEARSLDKPWTSLAALSGQQWDRNAIVNEWLKVLSEALAGFCRYGSKAFIEEFAASNFLEGRNVELAAGRRSVQGEVLGIDEHGFLKLRHGDGSVKSYSSGEVTLDWQG